MNKNIHIEDGDELNKKKEEEAQKDTETCQDSQNTDKKADQEAGTDKKAETEATTDKKADGETATEGKDPLELAQEQIAKLKEQCLRSMAEFDNYRKRTLKEKAELILNGGEKAITTILPILDDMERAIDNGEKTDDPQVLREGMQLIYNKFVKTIEGIGVKSIDTIGSDFDTDVHEAVALVPGGDDQKGKVIGCIQKGYKLNEKVIRHAKVVVGQ